jgi:hypothetical protein
MEKNLHESHAVALFARRSNATGKTTWILRMARHGDRTPELDAVEFKWKPSQSWFATKEEHARFITSLKSGRKIIIRTDHITDLIEFLDRITPAASKDGKTYFPVHTEESAEAV